jgi:hypothetical protein
MSGVRREYAFAKSQTVLRRVRDRSRNLRTTENAPAPRLIQNHCSLELADGESNCSGRLELLASVNARWLAWVALRVVPKLAGVVDGEQSKARVLFCPTEQNICRPIPA